MSSLATAPSRSAARAAPAVAWAQAARRRLSADALLGVAIGAALSLEVFVTTGGVDLATNTWAEIVLTLLGAGLCATAAVYTVRERVWGASSLVLFGALAALTLASISWSVQPANSWVEANRTVSYLATFAGGLALARLAPARWRALIGGIAVLATIVSGYALLAKVFPATLDREETIARLSAPFDYFNAVGLMAALGFPACLWAGVRREATGLTRALAVPALAVLTVALVLSYSRGALIVAVIGVALWFALVPLRLRAAAVLALGAGGGGLATGWALATHPITRDLASLPARTTAGHAFGLVLILMVGVLTVAGFALAFALDRVQLAADARRRVGVGLLVIVACFPIGGVAALAASSRGVTGEISHFWHGLTSTSSGAGDNAGRLVEVSNSRGSYWSEGLKVGEHHLFDGAGAGGFGTASRRYGETYQTAQNAHGYLIQTFADFGLLGLCTTLALLLAWCVAAGRTVGVARLRVRRPLGVGRPLRVRRPQLALDTLRQLPRRLLQAAPTSAGTAAPGASPASASTGTAAPGASPAPAARLDERAGLVTLLAVAVIFGLHSAIDWTWFVPGVTVPALLCAGWLSGRGPLARPITRVRTREPALLAVLAAIAACALLGAWMIWQPLRSTDSEQAGIAALAAGNTTRALSDAQTALARDPVSPDPLWDMSAIYGELGRAGLAYSELVRAVRLQPANPETWLQLGDYDLLNGNLREANAVLQAALFLAPQDTVVQSALAQARSGLRTAAPSP